MAQDPQPADPGGTRRAPAAWTAAIIPLSIGCLALLLVVQVGRAVLLYRDFQRGLSAAGGTSLFSVLSPPTTLDFPLTASSTLEALAGNDLFTPGSSLLGVDISTLEVAPLDRGERPVRLEKLLAAFATFTKRLDLETEIETRFVPQVASFLPTVTDVASLTDVSVFNPEILIGGLPDMGRLLHALALYQAATGRCRTAVRTILVGLLIAHHVENLPGQPITLMGKMVGIILRGRMGSALLDVIPGTRLTREECRRLVAWLQEAERRKPTLYLQSWAERQAVRNLAAHAFRGLAAHPGHPVPHWYLQAYAKRRLLDSILADLYDQRLAALQASYSAAVAGLDAAAKNLAAWQKRTSTPGVHWVLYLLQPERFMLEHELSRMTGVKMTAILQQEYASDEALRGAQVAVALQSFQAEQGRWPADLPALEGWLGLPLPPDAYTDRPHPYEVASHPRLFSVGPDAVAGTPDDLTFVPVWGDPAFTPVASSVTALPTEPPLFP
ncbi:MAG: hypothetical protein GX442_18400 [Candidatus Riflebacteria bacterium]|nr:hypothetical protein [Candidatus Riflebacteria bacterium]